MYTVDSARSKYYHDASLDNNADLLMHVSDEGFFNEIDELTDLCLNTETISSEKIVSWAGIETLKITWIPLLDLRKDIPQLIYIMRWCEHLKNP
jgi:hypothetical protein